MDNRGILGRLGQHLRGHGDTILETRSSKGSRAVSLSEKAKS
jgi:hypothetical protein